MASFAMKPDARGNERSGFGRTGRRTLLRWGIYGWPSKDGRRRRRMMMSSFGEAIRRDYARRGLPAPNTDPETGIAYGISSGEDIPEWTYDESEPVYFRGCGSCGSDLPEDADTDDPDLECGTCGASEACSDGWFGDSPLYWTIGDPDSAFYAESDSDCIHWTILRSPHIVLCRECSPCFPCAGDISSAGEGSIPTYGWPDPDAELPIVLRATGICPKCNGDSGTPLVEDGNPDIRCKACGFQPWHPSEYIWPEGV
jgi:hypothetical protein